MSDDTLRMPTDASARPISSQRSVARKLALQALYRWQLNECPWQDLIQEFSDAQDMPRADREYFRELVEGVWRAREALDADLSSWADRSPALLDPIEHAILLIGVYELRHRLDVPFRVAINEAVTLAKRFGATDGHKYVNAVLDRAARAARPDEH
ncbi:MAG TPA: transcription antitermination factor NusB [Steroidobacteraceae bacterium]|nr:transcription antitermination factor NusB [Steroidobacteraceae bacterium]